MLSALSYQTQSPAEAGATPDFYVMLLYQDVVSGLRTKEFFDELVRDHGARFRFLCQLWKFDLLQAPGLKDRALAEAVDVDMLAIGAHGDPGLPPATQGLAGALGPPGRVAGSAGGVTRWRGGRPRRGSQVGEDHSQARAFAHWGINE